MISASNPTSNKLTPRLSTSQKEKPLGINLAKKLHTVAVPGKEFAGLPHVFVSALGRMAYAELDALEGGGDEWDDQVDDKISPGDLRTVQCKFCQKKHNFCQIHSYILRKAELIEFGLVDLAQDLLEAVVEGPEGDNIYEIYVEDDDEPSQDTVNPGTKNKVKGSGDGEGDIDMEAYAAMGEVGAGDL